MSQTFDAYRKTYRDAVAESVSFSGLGHDFFMRAKAQLLQRMCAAAGFDMAGSHLLDVGCGVGSLHAHVGPMFGRISGVDVSRESIAEARLRHPAFDYQEYDGGRLPVATGSVDMSLAVCVVHHVPPRQWPAFVAEMKRVVRPDGLVCIIEHNPFNPLTRLGVARCAFDADAVLLSPRRTGRLLADAGVRELDTRHFLLSPFELPVFGKLEQSLERLPLGGQYAVLGRA